MLVAENAWLQEKEILIRYFNKLQMKQPEYKEYLKKTSLSPLKVKERILCLFMHRQLLHYSLTHMQYCL